MSDGIVGTVKVKPLVWDYLDVEPDYHVWEVLTGLGRYKVQQSIESDYALLVRPNGAINQHPTIEAAKAAAQADYDARIMASLDVQPITVQDAVKVPEVRALIDALRSTLNFVENTENEMGIILGSGDRARAALRAIPDVQ